MGEYANIPTASQRKNSPQFYLEVEYGMDGGQDGKMVNRK